MRGIQSRSSGLRSYTFILRKLDETRESGEFHYRLNNSFYKQWKLTAAKHLNRPRSIYHGSEAFGSKMYSFKGTVDLQKCLPENRSYEHCLR